MTIPPYFLPAGARLATCTIDAARQAVSIAANAGPPLAPDAEDGWFLVAPYGDVEYVGVEKGRRIVQTQRFLREDAETMAAGFNSLLARLGRAWRGLAIYRGHPDVEPDRYPDDRRLGRIVALDVRDDGLWAKPVWNKLGRENLEEGYWVYPSPAWFHPPADNQGVFRPDELLSVGLTNMPRIAESRPVTDNAATQSPAEAGQPKNNMQPTPELMARLGLTEDREYTPEEIEGAIFAMCDKAEMADNAVTEKATAEEAATNARTAATNAAQAQATAENALQATRTAHAETLLEVAVNDGRITKAEAEELRPQFAEDFDAAAADLAKRKPASGTALNTRPLDIGGRRVAISSARERRAAINAELERRLPDHGGNWTAAWNAVKGDPQWRGVFAAMETARGKED